MQIGLILVIMDMMVLLLYLIYSKTAKLWKNGAALKSLGEKSWEIKGSGQEWLQWC